MKWDHNRNPPRKEIPDFRPGELVDYLTPGTGELSRGRIVCRVNPGESLFAVLAEHGGIKSRWFADVSKRWTRYLIHDLSGEYRTPNAFMIYKTYGTDVRETEPAKLKGGLGRPLVPRSEDRFERVGAFVEMANTSESRYGIRRER